MPVSHPASTHELDRAHPACGAPADTLGPRIGVDADVTMADGGAGAAAVPLDAIAMLRADHRALSLLFAEYDSARSAARRKALVADICAALRVHGQIEEEIFYPEVMTAVQDPGLVSQATAEHRTVLQLIAQLQVARSGSEPDAATVGLLAASVRRHIGDANQGLFPQAQASALDLEEIGDRMAARRDDLLHRLT